MTLLEKHNFQVYADYHQFYMQDECVSFDPTDLWTKEAHLRGLGVAKNLVAIGTDRYETVPVTVEIYEAPPPIEADNYSRINECSFEADSGIVAISGCLESMDESPRIKIEPGIYRVRVLYGNLETVVSDWVGDDFYVLQLWKDSQMREVQEIKIHTASRT